MNNDHIQLSPITTLQGIVAVRSMKHNYDDPTARVSRFWIMERS